MLQFPKHGNKEILERNGRLRITSGPVFTRHLNATTTMAVRSVTSSPGASWERRFKGRGARDVGRGTWGEGRGKACCEEQPLLTHPVSHTHTTQGGARDETEGKVRTARNNHCSLTLFLTLTLLKEGRGTWDETEEKLRGARKNHCSLTLFLTLTLLKELRGTRREERGTNSYSLFTCNS